MYTLKTETVLHTNLEKAWAFFSSPENLEKLTPAYMGFKVIDCPDTKEIFSGMLIKYRVKPVLQIPLTWVTKISDVVHEKMFSDIQLKGPYSYWQHEHTFTQQGEVVLMTDTIHYALPFGILGKFAHWLFVSKQLQGIFAYRSSVIHTYFPKSK